MIGRIVFLLAFAVGVLSGCTRSEPLAPHGAAMMRVEVEVYEGPLSAPPSAQTSELVAVMSDTIRASADWRAGAQALMGQLQCGVAGGSGGGVAADCAALRSAADSAEDAIGAGCYMLDTPAMRDMVALATYLPRGTCGEHASAWRHIKEVRGDFVTSTDNAQSETERKTVIGALEQLRRPVEEENGKRAALKAATPEKRAEALAALQAATAKVKQAVDAFDRHILAMVQTQAGRKRPGQRLPTLYDMFVAALICAMPANAADHAANLAMLAGGMGRPGWPTPVTNNLRCEHEAVVLAVQNIMTKAANPAATGAVEGASKLLSLSRQFATGRVEGDSGAGRNADALLADLVARIRLRQAQFAVLQTKLEKEAQDSPATVDGTKTAVARAKGDEDAAFAAYNDERAKCDATSCPARDSAYAVYAKLQACGGEGRRLAYGERLLSVDAGRQRIASQPSSRALGERLWRGLSRQQSRQPRPSCVCALGLGACGTARSTRWND